MGDDHKKMGSVSTVTKAEERKKQWSANKKAKLFTKKQTN